MKSFSIVYFNKLNNISSLGIFFKSSFIFSSINIISFSINLFLSAFLGEPAIELFLSFDILCLLVFLGDLFGDLFIIFLFKLNLFFFSSFIISMKGFNIFIIGSNSSFFLLFSSFNCSI